MLSLVRNVLTPERVERRGLFDEGYVKTLLAAPNSHQTTLEASKLWQLALLELWLQRHVDEARESCATGASARLNLAPREVNVDERAAPVSAPALTTSKGRAPARGRRPIDVGPLAEATGPQRCRQSPSAGAVKVVDAREPEAR